MLETTPVSVAALLANLPQRICDRNQAVVRRMPEQPALVEASGAWTYRQLATAVADTQRWLLDASVRPAIGS